MIETALTFRLGDGVADFGPDVMLAVPGKDEGQAEETHAHRVKSKRSSLFVSRFSSSVHFPKRRAHANFRFIPVSRSRLAFRSRS